MNIGWRYPVGRHGPHHFHHMQSKITCHYTKRTTFCKERLCIGRNSKVRFHPTIAKHAILIYAVAQHILSIYTYFNRSPALRRAALPREGAACPTLTPTKTICVRAASRKKGNDDDH